MILMRHSTFSKRNKFMDLLIATLGQFVFIGVLLRAL